MNGEARNATIAISVMAARAPGLARAARTPMRMRANNGVSSSDTTCAIRTAAIAITTAKKLTALTVNAHP